MATIVIDCGIGNLWSVTSALDYLGVNAKISGIPSDIISADALILPGVGSFSAAMATLTKSGVGDALMEAVSIRKRKILGICLGMQLFATKSSEGGVTQGLNLIPGDVSRFDDVANKIKVPHIGFNAVSQGSNSVLFRGLHNPSDFYFVHSYRMLPTSLVGCVSTCDYGEKFLAAYECENIFATQFHPEKSQTNGLRILKNFLDV